MKKRFPVYTLSACLVAVVWYFAPKKQQSPDESTRKGIGQPPPGVMEIVDRGTEGPVSKPTQNQASQGDGGSATPTGSSFLNLHKVDALDYNGWLQQMSKEDDNGQAKVIAGMLSNDGGLVREGVEMDEGSPMLAYVGSTDPAFSAEEQLLHSKRFYANDPENALAAFIYATRLFEHGNKEGAFQVLQESKDRQVLDDYSLDRLQLMKEAYQAAGLTNLEAQLQSTLALGKPYLGNLLSFVGELDDVADTLPPQEAANLRNLTSSMGIRVSQSAATGTILDQLTGLAMEERSLEGLGDDDNSPFEGMTVEEAQTSIKDRRDRLKDTISKFSGMDALSILTQDPVLMEGYFEAFRRNGELEAIHWLIGQFK